MSTKKSKSDLSKLKIKTQLSHVGRKHGYSDGLVNLPVQRGSTVLFENCNTMKQAGHKAAQYKQESVATYGRHGTTPTFEFEQAMTQLYHGYNAVACASGTAAATVALSALLKAGDHILMVDSAYGPTRKYCDEYLSKFNITTTYYSPRIGADIESLIQEKTKIIYLESPGSLTFEVQDTPAIVKVAKSKGIYTLMDNTWATALYHQPLEVGVDGVIESATKYIGGHSDILMGILVGTEQTYPLFKKSAVVQGQYVAADEIYLALRGLRTLSVRLEKQSQTALELSQWLQTLPNIAKVHNPCLPNHPDHHLWKRDFSGASGLFAIELKPQYTIKSAETFVDALQLFGIGFSWGGFESLAIPVYLDGIRSVSAKPAGPLIRFSIGLEDLEDLKQDILQALNKE
ncbi:MAG: cystathionine beta-lyase [Pseudobdellovibrionaceae bacterium]